MKTQLCKAKKKFTKDYINIQLPRSVAKDLKLTENTDLYFLPINGTIQLCTKQPVVIPALSLDKDQFLPQS